MCFSLGWIEQLVVWLIVAGAIIAIIKLLVPWVTSITGFPIIGQILMIVLWAIVAIMAVYIVFGLLSCLLGGAGGFPRPIR
jgi:hypothetical protein